ncbi:MAG: peroxide stress protein YaaA [Microcella sp.]|nr:peroxide stress protein YaaA [Microcella sp.]
MPPSETKRSGGTGPELALDALSFASLTALRRGVVDAVQKLSADEAESARALKLGAKAAAVEVARNRELTLSPTMPAVERYTGVLFDALAVHEWQADARARASAHIMVHSALFGLLSADDPIPAYRLSHDSRLPGLRLRAHWAEANTAVLQSIDAPLIDLRSAGYAALGPLPGRDNAAVVTVVAIGADGVVRALNHFNKKGKGDWVKALLSAGPLPESIDSLCAVSNDLDWPLRRLDDRTLELVVPGVLPPG